MGKVGGGVAVDGAVVPGAAGREFGVESGKARDSRAVVGEVFLFVGFDGWVDETTVVNVSVFRSSSLISLILLLLPHDMIILMMMIIISLLLLSKKPLLMFPTPHWTPRTIGSRTITTRNRIQILHKRSIRAQTITAIQIPRTAMSS